MKRVWMIAAFVGLAVIAFVVTRQIAATPLGIDEPIEQATPIGV